MLWCQAKTGGSLGRAAVLVSGVAVLAVGQRGSSSHKGRRSNAHLQVERADQGAPAVPLL